MGKPRVHRSWMSDHPEVMDEVAEYRLHDYECAMREIRTLVDHVDSGDVLFTLNEGFSFPKDYSVVDLWKSDDGYHALFPQRSGPPRKEHNNY